MGTSHGYVDQTFYQINDLNTPLTSPNRYVTPFYYNTAASNKPSANGGFGLCSGGKNTITQQMVFDIVGDIYTRYYANGTTSAWKRVANSPTTTELLWITSDVPTTVTSYNCNWGAYDFLLVQLTFFGNIQETATIPYEYFNGTGSSRRVYLKNWSNNVAYEIYKDGTTKAYCRALSSSTNYGIRISGIKF